MARKGPEQPKPPPPPRPEAPGHLSDGSKALWATVVEHDTPAGRLAVITAALEARDRAEQARLAIERDGLTTTTKSTGAVHVHPLCKIERDNRALFAKLWLDLALQRDVNRFTPWP